MSRFTWLFRSLGSTWDLFNPSYTCHLYAYWMEYDSYIDIYNIHDQVHSPIHLPPRVFFVFCHLSDIFCSNFKTQVAHFNELFSASSEFCPTCAVRRFKKLLNHKIRIEWEPVLTSILNKPNLYMFRKNMSFSVAWRHQIPGRVSLKTRSPVVTIGHHFPNILKTTCILTSLGTLHLASAKSTNEMHMDGSLFICVCNSQNAKSHKFLLWIPDKNVEPLKKNKLD